MTPEDFVKQVRNLYPDFTHCYLAIMPVGGLSRLGNYDIEVEISSDVIAGCYRTNTSDLEIAREVANVLDFEFSKIGVMVHNTRTGWELYLESLDEAENS